eukprot:SAG11_NODE_13511_length_651_cov_6.184783_1_plen_84_part_01
MKTAATAAAVAAVAVAVAREPALALYRRWIASYAKLTAPLNELLKKKVDYGEQWAKNPTKYQSAVDALKRALVTYPILRQPNFH